MTEQMPGELIYEYTIQSTGATSYGALALDALLSGVADIRPQGAPVRPRGLARLLRSRPLVTRSATPESLSDCRGLPAPRDDAWVI